MQGWADMGTGWTIGHFKGVPITLHLSMLIVIPLLTVGIAFQNLPALMSHFEIARDSLAIPPLVRFDAERWLVCGRITA